MKSLLKSKPIQNASWLIGARIVQAIIGVVISMVTARYLGPSDFGLINYASSLVSFFTPIMQLGITSVLVQETIEHPEEEGEIYGTAQMLCLFSAGMCVIGMNAFVRIANVGERDTIIVCALYSTLLVVQAFSLIEYWYQAKLLAKYSSIISMISYLVMSIYKIYILVTGKSVAWFAVSQSFDFLILAVGLNIVYRKKGGKRFKISFQIAKRIINKSKYYIISGLMIVIFAQTDKIMLKMMIGETSVGYYSAATVCANMAGFVFSAIIDSMRPVIFSSIKISQNKFRENMSKLYCIISYFSLAQCLFITFFSKTIITILYGKMYSPSVLALKIIVWYTTFSYYGAVRDIWILSQGKQKYIWKINLLGAATNVLLNFLLIPSYSIYGAAVASLITQIFTNVILGYIIKPLRENNRLLIRGLNIKILFK